MSTHLNRLTQALEHLAAPAAVQEQYLLKLGTHPSADELALEFSDVADQVPEMCDAGLLPIGAAQAISAVDTKLRSFGGEPNEDLWTVDALHVSKVWQDVRRLAATALEKLKAME